MELTWTEQELEAINQLAKELDLTPSQVLRQALRFYQLHHHRISQGETFSYSGDAERAAILTTSFPEEPTR